MASHIKEIIDRTHEMAVGETYFLSSLYDKDGAWVRVLKATTETNGAGWPSTVTYKVLESVGDARYYTERIGKTGTCNATNLYEQRHHAAHAHKYRHSDWAANSCDCA